MAFLDAVGSLLLRECTGGLPCCVEWQDGDPLTKLEKLLLSKIFSAQAKPTPGRGSPFPELRWKT